MTDSARYLVAYDISDNRERYQVDKLLQGFGFRRQKSVFECRLTLSMLGRLRGALTELALATGFVLIERLAQDSQRIAFGAASPASFSDDGFAFVA